MLIVNIRGGITIGKGSVVGAGSVVTRVGLETVPPQRFKFFVDDYLSVCRMFHHSQSLPETRLGLFEEYIRMASTCEELGTGPGERWFPYVQFNDEVQDWAKKKDGGKTWL